MSALTKTVFKYEGFNVTSLPIEGYIDGEVGYRAYISRLLIMFPLLDGPNRLLTLERANFWSMNLCWCTVNARGPNSVTELWPYSSLSIRVAILMMATSEVFLPFFW